MLTNKSSVQMVADDPHLASEIMLLVRMMFIDGELNGPELELFKQYCHSVFDIPEEDVPEVVKFLREYGYETSGEQAAAVFSEMPGERKAQLLGKLITMARADNVLHEKEVDLIARVSRVLGYTPEQVNQIVAGL
ncbi:MAG: TerB family tellurite resistance protein [Hyphomicrobiales bacterium]|nr:TerB family tellurite resistance protein [Hyphomicrobiales bacterium]